MSAPRTFAFPEHDASNTAYGVNNQLSHSPASSTGSRGGWLGRLRRNSSPNNSKSPSPAGSPRSTSPSFVVRSVVKQSGGVNAVGLTATEGHEHNRSLAQGPFSLDVPRGGPGGGTGYGTAYSSNDGRPEELDQPRSPSEHRSGSPSAMNAKGFQQSVRERQNSLRSRTDGTAAQHLNYNQIEEQQLSHASGSQRMSGSPAGPRPSPISSTTRGRFDSRLYDPPNIQHAAKERQSTERPVASVNYSPSLYQPAGPNSPARTPFGSVSPAGSPNFASKVMRGILGFGARSPRNSDREDGIYIDEGDWVRRGEGAGAHSAPYGTLYRDEEEARHQKAVSQLQAARIVDAERQAAIESAVEGSQRHYDPLNDKPWAPRQAIGSPDDVMYDEYQNWSHAKEGGSPLRKARKPVPPLVDSNGLATTDSLQAMPMPMSMPQVMNKLDSGQEPKDETASTLTPAQRIIQETRSRQLVSDSTQPSGEAARGPSLDMPRQLQRGFDVPFTTNERKDTVPGRQPREQTHLQTSATTKVTSELPPIGPPSKLAEERLTGLTPGSGPTFANMSLTEGLQSLLVRFFRYERYSVPLIRSLETRLLDIERDAQMAQLQDGDSLSARSLEMDRWVTQIQSLIKHELGQLKAGCREIREARELVAEVALRSGLRQGREASSSQSAHKRMPRQPSAQEASNTQPALSANESSSKAIATVLSPPKKSDHDTCSSSSVAQSSEPSKSSRLNNISSASFQSAIPFKAGVNNLQIRSTSPIGRPYYTDTLKQDAIAQPVSSSKQQETQTSSRPSSPSAQSEFPTRAANSSPSLSDSSSGSFGYRHKQKDLSVEHRLKALMSRSSSSQLSLSLPMASIAHDIPDEDDKKPSKLQPASTTSEASKHVHESSHGTLKTLRPIKTEAVLSSQSSSSSTSAASFTTVGQHNTISSRLQSPGTSQQAVGRQSSPTSRSTSPSLIPDVAGSSITTTSRASQSLRARAQSYLQIADGGQTGTQPTTDAGTSSKNNPLSSHASMKDRVAFFST